MKGKHINFSVIWIAFHNLRKQRFQTLLIFTLLFITSITMFFSEYLTISMKEGIHETKKRIGADLIVVPNQFVSKIEDALFLGRPCTVNFDKVWLDKIKKVNGVKQVSFQLYISSLSMDCCDSKVQLIAFDKNTDFVVSAWLSKKGIKTIKKDEIILGCNLRKKVGDSVTYYARNFKVADVLSETGMGYDNCAFIRYETAYDIANDTKYRTILPFQKDQKVISMVQIKLKNNKYIEAVKNDILNQYGDQEIDVYSQSELVSRFVQNLENFIFYGNVLRLLFIILSTTALYGLYCLSIHLRKEELGTYFSFGSRKITIQIMLIIELLFLALLATIIGEGLVCLVVIPFHELFKEMWSIPYLMPDVKHMVGISFQTFLINVILCIIASVKSFYELANIEVIYLIKSNNK